MPTIITEQSTPAIFKLIRFNLEPISSHLAQVTITVPAQVSEHLQARTIDAYKRHAKPPGLESYNLPTEFILERYNKSIHETIERFTLRHCVMNYLLTQIKQRKMLVVHHPRLTDVTSHEDGSITYVFRLSTIDTPSLGEWRKFPFKSPKRKLYKDLDKQVEAFCEREGGLFNADEKQVTEGDWLELSAEMLNDNEKPLFNNFSQTYWFKFSTKYVSDEFREAFINKKAGDIVTTKTFPYVDNLREALSECSTYRIKIVSISRGHHFSVEHFKRMFNVKTKAEIHKKLIEVFSFRNDISQRKSIIEEVFTLLLSKQRFEIPQHLTLRKQEDILMNIRKLPDYHVYKAHKNFEDQLEKLAEKQLKEEALIDSISYRESMTVSRQDIQSYLHLFNHDRLKEFVHFKPAIENFDELDKPIPETILREAVLREKTLNTVIYQLTR